MVSRSQQFRRDRRGVGGSGPPLLRGRDHHYLCGLARAAPHRMRIARDSPGPAPSGASPHGVANWLRGRRVLSLSGLPGDAVHLGGIRCRTAEGHVDSACRVRPSPAAALASPFNRKGPAMIAASVLLGLLVGVLLLPSLSDLLSLICIALGRAHAATRACAHLPRLLFLVPAHNEELLIQSCLQSLQGQRYPPERRRIVVIADNCMDRTASLARAAGAHCLDRRDPDHPGKPSAIAWGLKELSLEQVDAVVIVHAD